MTSSAPEGPVVHVKPQPNLYTVLVMVAAGVLLVALIVVLYTLLAAPPQGYGLTSGDLFSPTDTTGM